MKQISLRFLGFSLKKKRHKGGGAPPGAPPQKPPPPRSPTQEVCASFSFVSPYESGQSMPAVVYRITPDSARSTTTPSLESSITRCHLSRTGRHVKWGSVTGQ